MESDSEQKITALEDNLITKKGDWPFISKT